MPKKNLYTYSQDFYNILKKNYGNENVTSEIYQKEILKFIKTMDSEVILGNITKFINGTAYDLAGSSLARDKNLYPNGYFGNLMEDNIPSKDVYKALASNLNKDAYVNYCNKLINKNNDLHDKPLSEGAKTEYKMNKFKMVEALKPTGNSFTKFFKKLFNIGGYNQKLEAYNRCKDHVRQLVGNKLTDEQFVNEINSTKKFNITNYKSLSKGQNVAVNDFNEVNKISFDKVKSEENELVNELSA